jgi:hypothetical protein
MFPRMTLSRPPQSGERPADRFKTAMVIAGAKGIKATKFRKKTILAGLPTTAAATATGTTTRRALDGL